MVNKLFIKQKYLDELISIFDLRCPNAIIWAYGSRVNGDAHDGSDLDLVVKDFGNSDCYLYELKEYLKDSNIPFLIDIVEYKYIPESFQKEIEKNYIEIYPRNIKK